MRYWLAGLVVLISMDLARAQDPRIKLSSEQEEVVVGQPYILRVEILVPTFMPEPPAFPDFELPGLLVRLPERATSPTSERIDGETWSGLRRTYRIYPMAAGVTDIPGQPITITYTAPDTNEPRVFEARLPATRIVASVPDAANGLDPLIIARSLDIDETWQMPEGPISVGDAVVRQLDIEIEGTSPLFIPPLLGATAPGPGDKTDQDAPFRPYPEDPRLSETEQRGVMSGTRREKVTYIANAGGQAVFPEIVLQWYNLETAEVEEIRLDERAVDVLPPPAERVPPDPRAILRAGGLLAGLTTAAWLAWRWLGPWLLGYIAGIRARHAASAHAAHAAAMNAAKRGDLDGLLRALHRRTRAGHPVHSDLQDAISRHMRAIYREQPGDPDAGWREIRRALRHDRPPLRGRTTPDAASALPPLNPFT